MRGGAILDALTFFKKRDLVCPLKKLSTEAIRELGVAEICNACGLRETCITPYSDGYSNEKIERAINFLEAAHVFLPR